MNALTGRGLRAALLLLVAAGLGAAPAAGQSPALNVSDNPDPRLVGRWDTVIPEPGGGAIHRILGMQTVHAVLLPSGKVLLASGSSWRNLAPVEYYPEIQDPAPGTGLFRKDEDPFRRGKLDTYYQLVNHVAIYDPEANTFFRIPHPVPVADPDSPGHFAPNDLFCTGHMQLPDGNPLFTGGTQYYFPYRTGVRSTEIFDWRKELTIDWRKVDWRKIPGPEHDPWIFSGFMKRGRWYPTLVPLLDGRMVVWSGFVGFDPGFPPMYRFEINPFVEFFDPAAFDRDHPQAAWKAIDAKSLPGSPFRTLINPDFKPPGCADRDFFDNWQLDTAEPSFKSPCDCDARCREDNKYDAFKLYPNNYLMPDGRIYLTREGDWVSLRTPDTAYMRRTNKTYWAEVGGTPQNPKLSFSPGPDRPEEITSYGTTFLEPESGDIVLLGGQPTSPGTLLPINSAKPNHFAGGLGSRKLERFHPAASEPAGGSWTLDKDFLGTDAPDDRTMHYATLLPTRQVLVVNGANYDFYGPIFTPWLLTPAYDAGRHLTGYRKERMSAAVEPRLYHNAALLLPDARVLVSGGNSARATVRTAPMTPADPNRKGQPLPDLSLVDIDLYFLQDGPMAKGEKGMLTTPTENWTAEIFTPPYLFIDPGRRPAIQSLTANGELEPGVHFESEIGGKTYYLLHSNRSYDVELGGLPETCPGDSRASLVLIKLPSATHGWDGGQRLVDLPFETAGSAARIRFRTPAAQKANLPPAFYMLFYVDCKGKPSVARMVRFDDRAAAV